MLQARPNALLVEKRGILFEWGTDFSLARELYNGIINEKSKA